MRQSGKWRNCGSVDYPPWMSNACASQSTTEDPLERNFFVIGALSAFVAVAAGAFGAHWLGDRMAEDLTEVYETAARYQMYHALALLAVGWAAGRWEIASVRWAGWLFVIGTAIFSGSLVPAEYHRPALAWRCDADRRRSALSGRLVAACLVGRYLTTPTLTARLRRPIRVAFAARALCHAWSGRSGPAKGPDRSGARPSLHP